MSIINEALKKAGQDPGAPKTASLSPEPGILKSGSFLKETAKKKQKVNWGPVFVLMVLVLITGPLVAPIFSSPYRSTNSAFLVPSYQEAMASSQSSSGAGSENRKAQFAIEESPILPAQSQPAKNVPLSPSSPAGRPNFSVNGIVYSSPDSYCLINGQVVKVGEKIDGATLKSVSPDKAVLDYQGTTIDLWVNRG